VSAPDPLDRLDAPDLDVATALRALRAAFATIDPEAATAEARRLVGALLGLDLTALTLGADRPISPDEARRLAALARRRLTGEPLARLIGSAPFWGRDFALAPATLVPHPDTETLVEAVLKRFGDDRAFVLADLGVGSGVLLVTLLAERPLAFGLATDLSIEALVTARENAATHGVADRAAFLAASYAEPLAEAAFDLIVSNPPYIARAEIAELDAEVRLHDPRLALDGGADGLDAYRAIALQARRALRPGGRLAVEIGWRQAGDVGTIFAAAGLTEIVVLPDLAGRDRVVTAVSAGLLDAGSGRETRDA
jgi:release factor glutamine methyltransferase